MLILGVHSPRFDGDVAAEGLGIRAGLAGGEPELLRLDVSHYFRACALGNRFRREPCFHNDIRGRLGGGAGQNPVHRPA